MSISPRVRDQPNLQRVHRPFIDWLKDNEPDTLSYTIFTRPKAPNEVLVFERYNSVSAFEGHRRSKVFRTMS